MLPAATNDRSFAMTSSFSGMVLAAAAAFGVISEAEIAALSARTAAFIPACRPLLEQLVRSRYQRVVYLGSGALKGLAREAALKMLELTDGRVIAAADSTLGFRHGPKTILNGQSLVVVFLCNDPHARRYDLDLVAELTRDAVAARVITVADAPVAGRAVRPGTSPGRRRAGGHGPGAVPGYAPFAQALAMLQSLALGISPDTPNAAGTVSRVVQGVTIYPWRRAPLRRYLGVDGGGSKTAFVLIDERGEVLGCHQEGPAYYLQTGMEPMRAMLARGILATLAQAALTPAAVDFAFLGLPSYGEDSSSWRPSMRPPRRPWLPGGSAVAMMRCAAGRGPGRAGGHQCRRRHRLDGLRRVWRPAPRALAAGVSCSVTRAPGTGWPARGCSCSRA